MPECPCRRQRPESPAGAAGEAKQPLRAEMPGEPAMRRWPHPAGAQPSGREEAALHYIRSALSYQNQTLADIKALLERVVLALEEDREPR